MAAPTSLPTYPLQPTQTRKEQLLGTVDEMVWLNEQDWSQPRPQDVGAEGSLMGGGWGSKRTVLFSGMRYARGQWVVPLLAQLALGR